jgi:hypothetical protein
MIRSYVVNYVEKIVSHTQTDTYVRALMLENTFRVLNWIGTCGLIGSAFERQFLKIQDGKED